MFRFEILYALAGSIEASWIHREGCDWAEAEQLANICNSIPKKQLSNLDNIRCLVNYSTDYEDWDSGVVVKWPAIIRSDLENADKQYGYRSDGENWEVYSWLLTGEEEWVGTVETEKIANTLSLVLRSNSITQEC